MIRRAVAADLPLLQARALDYFAEVGAGFSEPDGERLAAFVADTLANGLVLIAEDDAGEFLGMAGLARMSFPWSRQTVINERWLYVRQDRQCPGAGDALIEAEILIARRLGLDLWAGVVAGHRTPAHSRWRCRHGARVMGGVFRFGAALGVAQEARNRLRVTSEHLSD